MVATAHLPAGIAWAEYAFENICLTPFANGNDRTARLWVNSIASRYGLPPFLRLRPRPAGSYGVASVRAMLGDRGPTAALVHELLANFAIDADRDFGLERGASTT